MGVAAIKTDFGEGAPIAANYHAAPGLAMHNLYPLLYNEAVSEVTERSTGDGLVWSRSAYAGSQRFPVHWGGDPAALWEDLGQIWHGGLSLGLSGLPFWSVDIGGFAGQPSPELYIRWAQAGLFVSHPRVHGAGPREPWDFGAEAVQIFRRYAQLRYRLMPYVWSMAHRCVATSLPFLRPLLLDWPDDPTTAVLDDQYLFGEWLLVAPILDESNQRQVYLPDGRWFNYWTDEVFDGPRWLSVDAPLDTLLLYVRGGAILPLAPDMQYAEEKPWEPLTLEVYPHGNSQFILVDGSTETVYTSQEKAKTVKISLGIGRRQTIIRVHGLPKPQRVVCDGFELPYSEKKVVGTAVWFVNEANVVIIQVSGGDDERIVTIHKP